MNDAHDAQHDAAHVARLLSTVGEVALAKPSRPRLNEEAVLRAAVDAEMDRILAWGENDYDTKDEQRERVLRDFAAAMEFEDDAYRVCRDLETKGYDADSELVELVGEILSDRFRHLDNAERAWVSETSPEVKFKVGDRVSWHRRRGYKSGTYTGEIVEVDATRARYHVFCAELGHVRPGSPKGGTLAAIVNAEDAWAALPIHVAGADGSPMKIGDRVTDSSDGATGVLRMVHNADSDPLVTVCMPDGLGRSRVASFFVPATTADGGSK